MWATTGSKNCGADRALNDVSNTVSSVGNGKIVEVFNLKATKEHS